MQKWNILTVLFWLSTVAGCAAPLNRPSEGRALTAVLTSLPPGASFVATSSTPSLRFDISSVETGRLPKLGGYVDTIRVRAVVTNLSDSTIVEANTFRTWVSEDGSSSGVLPCGFELRDDSGNWSRLYQVIPQFGTAYLEPVRILPGASVEFGIDFRGVVLPTTRALELQVSRGTMGNIEAVAVKVPLDRAGEKRPDGER